MSVLNNQQAKLDLVLLQTNDFEHAGAVAQTLHPLVISIHLFLFLILGKK